MRPWFADDRLFWSCTPRTRVGALSERALRITAALCGIAGPIALAVYFAAPAFTNWPYAGASAGSLTTYANSHQPLFFAGAWFQVSGTLLSLVFFLGVVELAGAAARLPGLVVIVASAALLGLVLVEAALLMEVPLAAANGDSATVTTTFDLSNGVFARVFPLAPASATYLGLGAVILGSAVLHRWLGYVAVGLGVAFEAVGILAIFTVVGLILAIILSVAQEFWIIAAAVALWRSVRRA
jgi:hypothetical protein